VVRGIPFLQVGAGAEGAAVAGEDRAAERGLVVEPGVEGVELVVAAGVDAV
jgi:hypothetical protein